MARGVGSGSAARVCSAARHDNRFEKIDFDKSLAFPFTLTREGTIEITDSQVDHFFNSLEINPNDFRGWFNNILA